MPVGIVHTAGKAWAKEQRGPARPVRHAIANASAHANTTVTLTATANPIFTTATDTEWAQTQVSTQSSETQSPTRAGGLLASEVRQCFGALGGMGRLQAARARRLPTRCSRWVTANGCRRADKASTGKTNPTAGPTGTFKQELPEHVPLLLLLLRRETGTRRPNSPTDPQTHTHTAPYASRPVPVPAAAPATLLCMQPRAGPCAQQHQSRAV
eukprot:359992-Chlamydomonas_euryale.AAC.5